MNILVHKLFTSLILFSLPLLWVQGLPLQFLQAPAACPLPEHPLLKLTSLPLSHLLNLLCFSSGLSPPDRWLIYLQSGPHHCNVAPQRLGFLSVIIKVTHVR